MSIRVSNNPKNNSLSAIMKNPKLSKLVEEALQSPIGSTKREQAKSILGSVNSANQNFQDRRGGGGSWGFPAFSPAGIFERIGGTAAAGVGLLGGQMGKGAKTNWDFAQSIPGSMGNFSKEFFRQAGYGAAGALGAAETGLTFKPYSETAGARAQSNIQDLYASPPPTKKFPMRGGIPPEESGFADFGTMMSGGDNMFKTAPTGKETSLKTKTIPEKELEDLKATYPLTDWSNIMSGGDSILKTADNISADKVANKEYDDYSSGEGYDDDSSGKGYDDYSSDSSTSTDILGNEWPLLVDTLEKGYESGLGSQGIVNALRSNKKVIDELFPDMPEDLKPYGASMYRHVDKLTDQLREEHTIDEQLADINRMKKRGLTIEKDLTKYMAARDKYIKKIDEMIDDVEESASNMSLADPLVSRMAKKYNDYLYTLKGRQQVRYTDFLNGSIDQHNAEISSATDTYNANIKLFNTKLQSTVNVATEDWNNMNTMLIEMYDNIRYRDKREDEVFLDEVKKRQAHLDLMESNAKLANGGIEFEKVDSKDRALFDELLGYTDKKDSYGDPVKTTPSPDLYGLMGQAVQDSGPAAAERFKNRFYAEAKNRSYNAGESGADIQDTLDFYTKTRDTIIARYLREEVTKEEAKMDIRNLGYAVTGGIGDGLASGHLNENSEKLEEVLKDLTGSEGWFDKAYETNQNNKKSFIKNNKEKIDPKILGAIFDTYSAAMDNGTKPEDFYNEDWDENTLIGNVVKMITDVYAIGFNPSFIKELE